MDANVASVPTNRGAGMPYSIVVIRNDDNFDFQHPKTRNVFIAKVFTILSLQMIFSLAVIVNVISSEENKKYLKENLEWGFVSLGVFICSYLMLSCSMSLRRQLPWNIIMLSILTMSVTGIGCYIAAESNPVIVCATFGVCGLFVFLIAITLAFSEIDITDSVIIISTATFFAILFIGIVLIISIFTQVETLKMVCMGIGVALFSLYAMFDMKLVVGGGRIELSPEEYILGALQIYVDIMLIFFLMYELAFPTR